MTPARWPRPDPLGERMLIIDPASRTYRDARVGELAEALAPGDLLVLNDAATVPASFTARRASGERLEVRLAGELEPGLWRAVLFGDGDWHTPTEERAAPGRIEPGETLAFGEELKGAVTEVSSLSPRLIAIRFAASGEALWSTLYRLGRPVQYSYLDAQLSLWHVQTRYGGRPWAVELPSAGRPLTWGLLGALAERGVGIARVTHAAGLSSTGDPAIDAALPFPERYDIPEATVAAIASTRARGGRVIAGGTSVVRALEGSARDHGGVLRSGEGMTDIVIRPGAALAVVDGLLTGFHEPVASHYALIQAFAPLDVIEEAYAHAAASGYLHHEFGDSCLILSGRAVQAGAIQGRHAHGHAATA